MTLTLALGPISLPTLRGDVVEALGDTLETVGAGVVPGERRPRARTLSIPVHADIAAANRWDTGLRMRRQVRALLENAEARMQGLYLNWTVDTELNGWLLVGGGDLRFVDGGVTFANFLLELSDCYVVANQRTHRAARRILSFDRRSPNTADYLSTTIGTGGGSATARHYLGVGVSDVRVGSTGAPATTATLSTRDGNLTYVASLADGEVIDFEQAEGDMHKATVRAYDDHGAPGTEASWEPVYGPDQPLAGAVLLDNAVCRVVPTVSTGHVAVQSWTGSAWVTQATVVPISGSSAWAVRLVEWTPDRAVLLITSLLAAGTRGSMYVTLQRGWSGPRVEQYARNAAGSATATVNVVVKSTGDATYQRQGMGSPSAIVSGTSIGDFTGGIEPWVALVGPGTDLGVALAVQLQTTNLRGFINASREGLAFESPTAWAGVSMAIGARATAFADAGALGPLAMRDSRQVPELVARV